MCRVQPEFFHPPATPGKLILQKMPYRYARLLRNRYLSISRFTSSDTLNR